LFTRESGNAAAGLRIIILTTRLLPRLRRSSLAELATHNTILYMWVNIYSDSLCTLREADKVNYLTLWSFISTRSSFCAKRGVSSFIFMFCCSPQTSIMNGIVWARAPDQCRISGPTHTLYRFREIKNTQAFSVITTAGWCSCQGLGCTETGV
jgi:hypothetical protein